MEQEYKLEKWEWTQEDFEHMGWHDCAIYALRFEGDIYLDIDYILQWNHPGELSMSYTFWMAPATLVFEQPTYLKLDVEVDFINGFEIAEISREKNEKGETIWTIETQEGNIIIGAEKYKQIFRRPPSFQFSQAVPSDERGGISFSLKPEKDSKPAPEILRRREQEMQMFSLAKQRAVLTLEKEKLDQEQLGIKSFLVEKRRLEEEILNLDNALKGSRFEN